MNATGMLADLLMRSSLLLALIWLAASGLRGMRGSASMRHMIWLLGLAGLALIPLLASVMPRVELPILPSTLTAAAAPVAESVPAPLPMASAIAASPANRVPVAPATSIGLGDLAQLLYLAVAAGLLGRLALGHWLLGRLWKQARPCGDQHWTSLLVTLSSALGLERRVALRIATGPAMPMTWGSLRPHILLPAEAIGWSEERLRIVLLHELAHVARHDSLVRAVAAVVSAFYWFNPAVWYAVQQMRREQEHACDDLVLSCGTKASAYARNLLEAAHSFRMPPAVAGLSVAMATPSELERRLTAIVRRGSRRRAGVRFGLGCAAAGLAAASLAASVTPVARGFADFPPPGPERTLQPRGPLAPRAMTRPQAPQPPLSPAESHSSVAGASAEASESEPADDDGARYARELGEYERDLRTYAVDMRSYDREAVRYNRDLAALSAHPGSPAPNRPNMPNMPNMPIPPTVPTVPTVPTTPTTPATPVTPVTPATPATPRPPAPVTPPKQGP